MFKLNHLLVSYLMFCLLNSCVIYQNNIPYDQMAPSRNQNVCGHLKDSVILYAVFVDVDALHPFSRFDIQSTIDSVHKACNWINLQADNNQIELSLKPIIHEGKNKWSFHEKRAYTELNLNRIGSNKSRHLQSIQNWADKISTYAGKGLKRQNRTKLGSRINIKTAEQFIARLRDLNETDNIALMFFINGYFEHYPSVTFNAYTNGPNVEYTLITQKNPAVIAHELLHLFGAVDLYPNATLHNFNYAELSENYPNEIMRITHKPIEKLMLSPITKYYIGWQNDLDKENTRLLYHLNNVIEY